MNKVREWVATDFSQGYKSLELREYTEQEPGSGEVRLKIEAFALNWGDMNLMEGEYTFGIEPPARVGMEAAGIVDMLGPDVEGIEVGQRYCTIPHYYYNNGASADSVVVNSKYITKAPVGLSAAESASLWMQYLTSYFPLAYINKVGPETNVLVTAATSTAGAAALEIGRLCGANMTATSRYESNGDYLRSKGANQVCISKDADFETQLQQATNGQGFDIIYDSVGGTVMKAFANSFAKNCKIYYYGLLDGELPELPMFEMFATNTSFHPYSLFNYVEIPEAYESARAFIYEQLASGNLKTQVDRVYPMEEYIDAWDYMRTSRSTHGKILIETGN